MDVKAPVVLLTVYIEAFDDPPKLPGGKAPPSAA
jgi:hypothetical protein